MTQTPSPIYLMLPQDADDAFMSGPLTTLLQHIDVGAVLLWAAAGNAAQAEAARAATRRFGVPLLVAGPIAATTPLHADGVHVEGQTGELAAALKMHAPHRMVGAGGVWNRHHAMQAGESGADYVLFGSADPARSLDHDRIFDLCDWWSNLFEIPCVAAAANLEDGRRLLAAGADFVALRDAVWQAAPLVEPGGAAAALAAMLRDSRRRPG